MKSVTCAFVLWKYHHFDVVLHNFIAKTNLCLFYNKAFNVWIFILYVCETYYFDIASVAATSSGDHFEHPWLIVCLIL